jgi:hypothetical protein
MHRNSRRGGVLAGIMLMVLMVGVLGIAALVTTGLYVADNVSLSVRDNTRFDPKHMGVPIYPGAVRRDDSPKLASFHFDFGDIHKGFAVSAAEYRTSDSVDRVTDFYRSELPHWLISQREDGRMQLSFTRHGYRRFVAIYEDDGETHIALASVGEPASN